MKEKLERWSRFECDHRRPLLRCYVLVVPRFVAATVGELQIVIPVIVYLAVSNIYIYIYIYIYITYWENIVLTVSIYIYI